MPITTRIPLRRLTQDEFSDVAYEVMRHVFDIHSELGRFFDEKFYKRELAHRLPGVLLEETINITYGSFKKQYFLDVLVTAGALFEFKSVEKLTDRHRAQLLHYLLLSDLAHGKLINVRPEVVKHEFVNTCWRTTNRQQFEIDSERWDSCWPGTNDLQEWLIGFLRDVGAGLGISLYVEAVTHFFGGPDRVEVDVPVILNGHELGPQRMRLIAPDIALKITGLEPPLVDFESHAQRILAHTTLRAIAWVNINMNRVTFVMLSR